ncbi:MAG TPA: hypothetical protein VNY05_43540 [Candidatus Acidoferrales bacterium]|nr:hypothetical protein [Candidatus Acidoferrales bacterium]
MKPTQSRIANFWCKLMHREPMWPVHSHYECRTCGQRHRVYWEDPSPATPRAVQKRFKEALPRETQAPGVSVTAASS